MELVEKIGLGTVQFGVNYGISNTHGKTTETEVGNILEIAKRNGVKFLDTASGYGNAEEVLGNFDLSSFKIVSKFLPFNEELALTDILSGSLKKLGVKKLYGYLAHRPLSLLNSNYWSELQNLKENNFIEKIGFSLNTVEELDLLLEQGIVPDIVQVPFNYFDARFEQSIKKLKKEGCEIHTRSTFLQGLFFINVNDLSPYFDEVKPYLIKLHNKEKNVEAFLLNYVANIDFIDQIIIGVQNAEQLADNINNLSIEKDRPKFSGSISENILMPSKWPPK